MASQAGAAALRAASVDGFGAASAFAGASSVLRGGASGGALASGHGPVHSASSAIGGSRSSSSSDSAVERSSRSSAMVSRTHSVGDVRGSPRPGVLYPCNSPGLGWTGSGMTRSQSAPMLHGMAESERPKSSRVRVRSLTRCSGSFAQLSEAAAADNLWHERPVHGGPAHCGRSSASIGVPVTAVASCSGRGEGTGGGCGIGSSRTGGAQAGWFRRVSKSVRRAMVNRMRCRAFRGGAGDHHQPSPEGEGAGALNSRSSWKPTPKTLADEFPVEAPVEHTRGKAATMLRGGVEKLPLRRHSQRAERRRQRRLAREEEARVAKAAREANGGAASEAEGRGPLNTLFSSMVFALHEVQAYAINLRGHLELDLDSTRQGILIGMQKEVSASFVWLFGQVFSRTPKLMLSLMLLLANFTAHSASAMTTRSVTTQQFQQSAVTATIESGRAQDASDAPSSVSKEVQPLLEGLPQAESVLRVAESAAIAHEFPPDESCDYAIHQLIDGVHILELASPPGGGGKAGRGTMLIGAAGGDDSTGRSVAGADVGETKFSQWLAGEGPGLDASVESQVAHLSESPVGDPGPVRALVAPLNMDSIHLPSDHVDIETLQLELEPDTYTAYDRTDLIYQESLEQSLGTEPYHPLLLANYAQFLYVVRRDNPRAEHFFRRALIADPGDGEVLGRFATFMWLAQHNYVEAESAYRAAIALDPSNPHYSGSYAHFLWHAPSEELSPGDVQSQV